MKNITINILAQCFPTLETSMNIDFDKTSLYMQHHCSMNMELITNNHPSHYAASDVLLREARSLYRNKEITWIEAAACFQEQHSECLIKDGKDATKTFLTALEIFRWISEQSDYLHSVYKENANSKRDEIFNRMENLERKMEAYNCIREQKTEFSLTDILYRLTTTRTLRYPDKEIQKTLYLLSYDASIFANALPLVVNTLHQLISNKLVRKDTLHLFHNLLNEKATAQEKEVAKFWYTDEWETLHPLITKAIQLQATLFLLSKETEEEDDLPIISARICRYLSRLPSPYNELLKSKSYTLLTGESKLNGRILWESLCDFNEKQFLEQIIMIHTDESVCSASEQENKWKQCHNTTNTLTLDNEGFTLSPLLPHTNHSWKGRKDKASLFNNRLFVISLSKPVRTFDTCENIKDFRLYWKQLTADFPLSQLLNCQTKKETLYKKAETQEKEMMLSIAENRVPSYDQDVKIRILFVDEENVSLQAEIIEEPFRGMKARLPFAYINSCYSIIPDFANLFTVNEIFRAKVKETDKGEIILSLIKDYNEFIYPECVRKKSLTAKVVEIRDGKVWWLLSSGATSTTSTSNHKKYLIGDVYKVEYIGLLSGKLKNNINIQSHVAHPDNAGFYRTVLENICDFFLYLTKEVLKVKDQPQELSAANKENNPFFVALQKLNLENTGEPAIESTISEESESESKEKDLAKNNFLLNNQLVHELIYCMDLLINDSESSCEQFNAYSAISLLCNFTGNKELARYYSLCADYIYNVDILTTESFQDRFTKGTIQKFSELLVHMESLGIKQYSRTLGLCKQIILVLKALFDANSLSLLQSFMQSKNQTVAELARYLSITRFLKENDMALQQLIYKNINLLLGFKEPQKKTKTYTPVYFGHEGVEKEFKSSAFIHPDKHATEEQCVVLARVIASFMNTDGGTLYIGVNDLGYLTGLTQELKFAHNDSDVYHRTVNRNVIRQLGEMADWNRYQEYIRSRLYEYEDGRMVLAFRVSPSNEVIKVKGIVYTRSASSNMVKLVQNIDEFTRRRHEQKLDSTPRKPEFPTFFSTERNEYIFNAMAGQPALPSQIEELKTKETTDNKTETLINLAPSQKKKQTKPEPEKENTKDLSHIRTSALRNNPLQKKVEHGYTPNHLFVSVFTNGKIAYSASPKIGVWGDKGKVLFSYSPEDKEYLMVTVFSNGEVGLSNLKKGISQPNTPSAFVNSISDLLFLSPAHKTDYLLLVSEKDNEKRYRIIALSDFEEAMSIQPKNTLILEPEKGSFIFAEILSHAHVQTINDDKVSLADFDQYNAGRYWEHSIYRQSVNTISKLCALTY